MSDLDETGGRRPLVVLMAVRNRREVTRDCVHELISQLRSEVAAFHLVVVDDGSSDGTPEMLASFSDVTVVNGSGDLYWGGAMRLAEARAQQRFPLFDRLWMNDDAVLAPDAISRLMTAVRQTDSGAILCGAFQDEDGRTTYSGARRKHATLWRLPFVLERVEPSLTLQHVDAFNGNLVFVPAEAADRLSGVDPTFTHHWGDFDYGLRARAAGVPVQLLPGFVGITQRNSAKGTWRDGALPRRKRWELLRSAKGFPPQEKRVYLKRHAGPLWSLQWLGVYAAQVSRIVSTRTRRGSPEATR